MSQVRTTLEVDAPKGTFKFTLDLQGDTELDHELLAAAFGSGRTVSISPAHKGDDLFAEFTIVDTSIWARATRALENRRRKADGKPTVEEEEAQKVQAEANAKAAREKADADAKAAQATTENRIAKAVASGVAAGLAKAKG